LASVERRLTELTPFIHAALRPELEYSALAQEEDLVRIQELMRARGAAARGARAAQPAAARSREASSTKAPAGKKPRRK
jgi:hypothetical protein